MPVDADPTDAVWAGMAWGRLGRADQAWEAWGSVDDPARAPWIAAEKGRLLRELGLHDDAEALEAPAFADCDDVVVRGMLAIGLTADAVGRNDVPGARRRLAIARGLVSSAAATPAARRQQLRLGWVEVEVALISGGAPPLDVLPTMDESGDITYPEAHDAGTDFHRAKGLLFSAVVHRDPRMLDAALPLAAPILAWAIHLARADVFGVDAEDEARAAWRRIVPPPGFEAAVAATSVGQRLG